MNQPAALVCTWCGKKVINSHWLCWKEAATGAAFQTRHGYARNRWGANAKHYDFEWYGNDAD